MNSAAPDLDLLVMHDNSYVGLFEQLDAGELNWLFSDRPLNSVRVYNHGEKSSRLVTWSDAPWPVIFLLGYIHRKHRFCGRHLPDASSVVSHVSDAINRLRWRAHFAGDADSEARRPLRYKRRTQPFRGQSSPEINGICFQLRRSLYNAVDASLWRAKLRAKRPWCNVRAVERAARDWLSVSSWAPVPSDKCGGFVLVNFDTLLDVQRNLLQGPWYRVFGTCCEEQTWRALVPEYNRICAAIATVDKSVSKSTLSASLRSGSKGIVSTLIHTCKTHKPDGHVAFRPVHASPAHSFNGVMAWISQLLATALSKYKHLLVSSDDLIERLTHVQLQTNDVFVHVDLKDFFMTGKVQWLTHHASLVVPLCLRPVFRRALSFLLGNQYITTHAMRSQWWRVINGSGMGLLMSSNVADAAFLHSTELQGLCLLRRPAKERFAVLNYFRFRDNLLFVCSPDFERIRSLKRNLEMNIHPYVGTLEEASHVGITFLDLNIVKDDRWQQTGKLTICPFLKPTALKQVLSMRSVHNPSTHLSWMKAYMFRLFKHSSSLTWFRTTKQIVLEKLREAGIDHATLIVLDKTTRFTFPVPISCSSGDSNSGIKGHSRRFWIRMPFHPVWSSRVCRSLNELSSHAEVQEVLSSSNLGINSFGAAWCLTMPSLAGIVRKY